MKLSIGVFTILGASAEFIIPGRVARDNGDRRYVQLTDMMEHYNSDFDEKKYWAYGCNCLILGMIYQKNV